MKLYFKQRLFSWLDSYEIYDENQQTVYQVEGKLAFGHQFSLLNQQGQIIGQVKEKIRLFVPEFELIVANQVIGSVKKEVTFFKPHFVVDFNNWEVKGDIFEWEYQVLDANQEIVATISKDVWQWTDCYKIEVYQDSDALYVVMLVLAIDAQKDNDRSVSTLF
ncbi:LURP-one-related/scramblase family protein [Enterococcus columbae]|uniref:LURP-one-related family protein n=1 Tax=Enterococcus columbae DSM 7374 = ATCC 51263 TaxID=1121865 RepID=S1NEM2_9ENTE|nr:LURP-one-related family protein [Enterococcus columbae]EOT44637.1 hypothetical protein OMW_00693 [Enterococcus columbae DSM 7374 = ATCC 51263]EOW87467.1 hypothetical protein I568_00511 [Enterococcus columbae DSM 7374 = ATCC 51263]OJG25124.1 hypothetical protein RR47_GL001912 [Enterococcus columbae DSM 7374 = ATCC 51263]